MNDSEINAAVKQYYPDVYKYAFAKTSKKMPTAINSPAPLNHEGNYGGVFLYLL